MDPENEIVGQPVPTNAELTIRTDNQRQQLDLHQEKIEDLERHLGSAMQTLMRLTKIVEALVVVVVESGLLEQSKIEPEQLIAMPPNVVIVPGQ